MDTQGQDTAGASPAGQNAPRRWAVEWNAAFNTKDPEQFASRYAEDAVVTDPVYPDPLRGREAIQQDVAAFLEAMPDAAAALQEVLVDGNTAASRLLITGTQTGPMPTASGSIPPTGRPVQLPMGVFSRFGADGRITEEHRYYDVAGMAAQLKVD